MAKKKSTSIDDKFDEVLATLNKDYGDGTVVNMNTSENVDIERTPTGSLKLDIALGGGYPKGKIIEVYGDESLGKSTFALHFLSFIKGRTAYIDTEQSLDREYAEHLGVNIDNMFISQPDYTEQALEITRKLCTHVEALVYDSIAEGVMLDELSREIGDQKMGDKAKTFSQAMRVLKSIKEKGTLFFVNQIRQKMSTMPGVTSRVTPGGNAMKFAAHIRIDMMNGGAIKDSDGSQIGHYIRCKLVKNKLGKPHIVLMIPIIYDGNGISISQELIDLGLEAGVITKSGSWFKHKDLNIAQGMNNTRLFIEDNPDFALQLKQEIIEAYGRG